MASSADVQYDQLIEWLLNRGKVQRLSWVSQLEALYCAADEALKKCQEQTEHAKEEGPVSDAFSISKSTSLPDCCSENLTLYYAPKVRIPGILGSAML